MQSEEHESESNSDSERTTKSAMTKATERQRALLNRISCGAFTLLLGRDARSKHQN